MKLMRVSGKPVDERHIKAYSNDLNKSMDLLEKALGKCTSANASKFEENLDLLHKDLHIRYPTIVEMDYPDTQEAMEALATIYPAVCFCFEKLPCTEECRDADVACENCTEELVCYIMDA